MLLPSELIFFTYLKIDEHRETVHDQNECEHVI